MTTAKRVGEQARIDTELAVVVRDTLHQDDRLSADAIDVTVVDSIATLSGTVQSWRRKLAAIESVESVRGIKELIDNIVVQPPGAIADEEIANNVRSALNAHADITREVITVSVKAGVVTLSGHVASPWERSLAGDVAFGARGVRDVKNLLLVDLVSKIEDEALTGNIKFAIGRTSGLDNCEIDVAVNGNTAVLSGSVRAPWQKRKAQSVAARYRISDVINDIRVLGEGA